MVASELMRSSCCNCSQHKLATSLHMLADASFIMLDTRSPSACNEGMHFFSYTRSSDSTSNDRQLDLLLRATADGEGSREGTQSHERTCTSTLLGATRHTPPSSPP